MGKRAQREAEKEGNEKEGVRETFITTRRSLIASGPSMHEKSRLLFRFYPSEGGFREKDIHSTGHMSLTYLFRVHGQATYSTSAIKTT